MFKKLPLLPTYVNNKQQHIMNLQDLYIQGYRKVTHISFNVKRVIKFQNEISHRNWHYTKDTVIY